MRLTMVVFFGYGVAFHGVVASLLAFFFHLSLLMFSFLFFLLLSPFDFMAFGEGTRFTLCNDVEQRHVNTTNGTSITEGFFPISHMHGGSPPRQSSFFKEVLLYYGRFDLA